MTLADLQRIESERMIGSYARLPVEFVRGEGPLLWDEEGNEYLDFLCGISVTSLGHCHPAVVAAVREQAATLMHVSNLFYSEPAMRLVISFCRANRSPVSRSNRSVQRCASVAASRSWALTRIRLPDRLTLPSST